MAHFYAGKNVPKDRICRSVYEELKTWPDKYHIFVEFTVGRQIDFMILSNKTCVCVEVKDYNGEIHGTINGGWTVTYPNKRIERVFNKFGNTEEDPFLQASNNAKAFHKWIINNKASIIKNEAIMVEKLRIFAVVVVPAWDYRSEVERHQWCYLAKGIEKLREVVESRSWSEEDLKLSNEIITRMAAELDLEDVVDVLQPSKSTNTEIKVDHETPSAALAETVVTKKNNVGMLLGVAATILIILILVYIGLKSLDGSTSGLISTNCEGILVASNVDRDFDKLKGKEESVMFRLDSVKPFGKQLVFLFSVGARFSIQVGDLIDQRDQRINYFERYLGKTLTVNGTLTESVSSQHSPQIEISDGSPPNNLMICK